MGWFTSDRYILGDGWPSVHAIVELLEKVVNRNGILFTAST